MCAINGFSFKNTDLLNRMNLVTNHRGPDHTGIFESGDMSFGHNRLSIIDTSSASNQPMFSRNRSLVITYNGELYNFKELKRELESDHKFITTGDTEVILAAYQKWGAKMLERFNGIFAIAIWDENKKELFLARDRSGVKPFYYFLEKGELVFSSEIKSILEFKKSRKVNYKALSSYFNLLYVPGPETMFSDIYKLPPSSYAVFKDGKLGIKSYSVSNTSQASEDKISEVIDRAVSLELISDRPVGLYLSGGLDSSALLHSMSKLNREVKTFSVGFNVSQEEESDKFNTDFLLARRTAKIYSTDHSELMVNTTDVISNLEKAIWHLDEPVSNSTIISMLMLSKFASEKVTVVLSGDGGDELFGGYERYRLSRVIDLYRKSPKYLRYLFANTEFGGKLNTGPGTLRVERFMFQDEFVLNKVLDTQLLNLNGTFNFFENNFPIRDGEDPTDHLMRVDQSTWLVDEALIRGDKLSMASGLESRVPFLNNVVWDFSQNLSIEQKVGLFKTKKILRDGYKNILPDYLINQPKRGWFSPGAKWLRNKEIFAYTKEKLLSSDRLPVNKLNIEKILDDHLHKRVYHFNTIWSLLTLKIWADTFDVEF